VLGRAAAAHRPEALAAAAGHDKCKDRVTTHRWMFCGEVGGVNRSLRPSRGRHRETRLPPR
jgi:hypothetical protein